MLIIFQKKDVFDFEVIYEFVSIVEDFICFDYLYVFMVVDICVINLKLWNGWCFVLLWQFYLEVCRVLCRGLKRLGNCEDWIEEIKEWVLVLLLNWNFDEDIVLELWDQLGDDYFLWEIFVDVVCYSEVILICKKLEEFLVFIGKLDECNFQGVVELFIYIKDIVNFFVAIVVVLD